MKRQRVEECTSALSWLGDDRLKIVVMNNETKCIENIVLRKDIEIALNISGQKYSQKV